MQTPFTISDSAGPDFSGRIALVTGATRGIGREAAKALAAAGAHVIALGRTQGALESLDDEIRLAGGKPASLVAADLRDFDGLDRLGGALYQRHGRLDILIGAAGVLGATTPVGHFPPKTWDEVIGVNLTANYRLLRSLDPLLRAADAARIVLMTCDAATRPRAFWSAYAASKAGLEALAATYADEVSHTPVRVAVVDPGAMRTKLRFQAFPGEDPATLPPPQNIAPFILELARHDREPPRGVLNFQEKLISPNLPAPAAI